VLPHSNFFITTCIALFKLLLSPCVLPYYNFCYHHVCYPTQTSVITTCVTIFNF
jgi:hypothetical protein